MLLDARAEEAWPLDTEVEEALVTSLDAEAEETLVLLDAEAEETQAGSLPTKAVERALDAEAEEPMA